MTTLSAYQIDVSNLFATHAGTTVVLAPRRWGTTTALQRIAIETHTTMRVSGRRAEGKAQQVLGTHAVATCDKRIWATDGLLVDCLPRRDTAEYLDTDKHVLVVLDPMFTVAEAKRAPPFFGTLKRIVVVQVLTDEPVVGPGGDAIVPEAAVFSCETGLHCYTYRVKFEHVFQFGDEAVGDAPDELLSWIVSIQDNVIQHDVTSCQCYACDTVFMTDAEQIRQVRDFCAQ